MGAISVIGNTGANRIVGVEDTQPGRKHLAVVIVIRNRDAANPAAPYVHDFKCNRCGEVIRPFYGEKNEWSHVSWTGNCRNPEPDSMDINERIRALEAEVAGNVDRMNDVWQPIFDRMKVRAEKAEAKLAKAKYYVPYTEWARYIEEVVE